MPNRPDACGKCLLHTALENKEKCPSILSQWVGIFSPNFIARNNLPGPSRVLGHTLPISRRISRSGSPALSPVPGARAHYTTQHLYRTVWTNLWGGGRAHICIELTGSNSIEQPCGDARPARLPEKKQPAMRNPWIWPWAGLTLNLLRYVRSNVEAYYGHVPSCYCLTNKPTLCARPSVPDLSCAARGGK